MPSKQTNKKQIINHRFTGLREAVVGVGITGQAPSTTVWTATGTSGNGAAVLAPLGVTGATLSGTSFVTTYGNVSSPTLRGLYNRALDFQWYRITRAKLVFVGNQGATIVGSITLSAYTDPFDANQVTYPAYSSGTGTRSFDLAVTATRECSIPIPVDTAWKKITSVTTTPANNFPFAAANNSSFISVNTVSDISVGVVAAQWTSNASAATTVLGAFYVDYDVEFKGPVDSAVNF